MEGSTTAIVGWQADDPRQSPSRREPGRASARLEWPVLLAGTIASSALFLWLRLPAAPMLAALASSLFLRLRGGSIRVPKTLLLFVQAIIGCLIARAIASVSLPDVLREGPVAAGIVAVSILVSAALGYGIERVGILPRTAGVWGMLPGPASAMTLLGETYGADVRPLASLQYLRVVIVGAMMPLVAHRLGAGSIGGSSPTLWAAVDWPNFFATLWVVFAGGALGLVSRVPGGALFGSLILGTLLRTQGWVTIELPPLLLAAGGAMIGWHVGLRFTRDMITTMMRALPWSFAATLALMAFCGIEARVLVSVLEIDPLTAYLATSPNIVDATAITSRQPPIDASLVMVLQVVRVLLVIVFAPVIVRTVSRLVD